MATLTYTAEQLTDIIAEARAAAREAAEKFFQEQLNGRDQYACGFAWTNIVGVKGNTKLGRALTAAGVGRDWTRAYQIWNPSGMAVQNVDTLYAGAVAAAQVLKKYGFDAYAGSRLD